MEDYFEKTKTECWNKALDSFGYAYIYSRRMQRLDFYLKGIRLMGIVVPILLGAITASYYNDADLMKKAIAWTTPLTILQLVFSAIATSLGSEQQFNNYITKSVEYNLLHSEFDQLAKFPGQDAEKFIKRYDLLVEREKGISKGSSELKDKERRMGMRAGLREYRRDCAGCGKTPLDIDGSQSKCNVCGNF